MFFPETLYLLSDRDQQVTWLDPIQFRLTTSAASAVVSSTLTIPQGRAAVITALTVTCSPGAAQNVNQIVVAVLLRGIDFNQPNIKETYTPGAANAIIPLDWQGEIVVLPGDVIRALAVFNAGVAVNNTTLSVFGILIPVGNLQR